MNSVDAKRGDMHDSWTVHSVTVKQAGRSSQELTPIV